MVCYVGELVRSKGNDKADDKTYLMRRDRYQESQSNTLDDFVMMRFNSDLYDSVTAFTFESC